MGFLKIFTERRVLSYMLSAALILFGFIGLRGIGVDRLPDIDAPFVTVMTFNPGAGPEIMNSSISGVLESELNTISGIKTLHSVSTPGVSEVMVEFELTKNPDVAFNEVQAKVNQVLNDLPREAEIPIVAKMDPNQEAVMWLVLKGDRPLAELSQLARMQIKKILETISGVGEVAVGGGRERKIRVDLDLTRLSALGLTAHDVMTAFTREHIQIPGGYLVGDMQEKLLYLDLEFHSVQQLGDLVVVWRNQVPVKLSDVAHVSDGLDDKRSVARFNGEEGVAIAVRKVQGANTVQIAREIQQRLETSIQPMLPDGVQLVMAMNNATVIEGIVSSLNSHIVEGTLLAALVVWLFLLNFPSTLIIATAIPVSLAGAVMAMYFGGYTFNMLTMSALLLLIGVVVDDAIVVLENIHRQHDLGLDDPVEAAVRGTSGVVSAVVAASLTLVCIFTTVIFMEGMIGVFMRSFAVVVSVGVVASLFVSLTLTPALCARFLKASEPPRNPLTRTLAAAHLAVESLYGRLLALALRFRWSVLAATTLLVASSGWFMGQLGSEFFPADDESRFLVRLEAPLGSSIESMIDKVEQAESILRAHPEVTDFLSTVGSSRSGEVSTASFKVNMVPNDERTLSQLDLVPMVAKELQAIAGVDAYASMYSPIPGLSEFPFQVYVTGPDLYELARLSGEMRVALNAYPGIGNVHLDIKMNRPQLSFSIDRNRAQALGISTQQIGDTVRVLAGGADIAKYNEMPGDGERYDIRLAAQRKGMKDFRDLESVYLRGPSDQLVQLNAIVNVEEEMGPASVQRRTMSFSAGLYAAPTTDMGEALRIFREVGNDILPAGYEVKAAGEAEEMEATGPAILFSIATGLIMVYMVLASQFNSFLQPALIMLAQPLAIVGGFVALWLAGDTLNIFSMIGMVLLVGLVSKNSILLVDLINQYRDQGMATGEAIAEACPLRMRPVLMTSLTIILAMLPAALGLGEGSGQYGPLAVVVIGGVVSSTLLTLLVVPVAYSLLDRWL